MYWGRGVELSELNRGDSCLHLENAKMASL